MEVYREVSPITNLRLGCVRIANLKKGVEFISYPSVETDGNGYDLLGATACNVFYCRASANGTLGMFLRSKLSHQFKLTAMGLQLSSILMK